MVFLLVLDGSQKGRSRVIRRAETPVRSFPALWSMIHGLCDSRRSLMPNEPSVSGVSLDQLLPLPLCLLRSSAHHLVFIARTHQCL